MAEFPLKALLILSGYGSRLLLYSQSECPKLSLPVRLLGALHMTLETLVERREALCLSRQNRLCHLEKVIRY